MRAIETLLAALGVKAEPETAAKKKPTAEGDEFEQAMTDALAPGAKKSPEKSAPVVSAKNLPLAVSVPKAALAQPLAATGTPDEKITLSPGKKMPAAPALKISDDLNPMPASLFPSVVNGLPPAVFIPVPASGDISAAPKKSPPAAGGKIAPANVSPPSPGGETKSVSPPVSPVAEKVLPGTALQAAAANHDSGVAKAVAAGNNFKLPPVPSALSSAVPKAVVPAMTLTVSSRTEKILARGANDVVPPAEDEGTTEDAAPANGAVEIISQPTSPLVNLVSSVAPEKTLSTPADSTAKTSRPAAASVTAAGKNFPPAFAPVIFPTTTGSPQFFSAQSDAEILAPLKPEIAGAEIPLAVSTSSQAMLGAPEKTPPAAATAAPVAASENAAAESVPANLPAAAAADEAEIAEPVARRAKLNSDVSPVAPLAASNSGTGVASTLPVMKNSDKMDFLAGSAGQKLPGAAVARSAENAWPVFLKDAPQIVLEKYSTDFSASAAGADNFSASPATATTTVNVLAQPASADAKLQMVERTHELVASHALRLAESKSDSLSVVLKPEAGTEISLQLRQKDGVVEASAVLSQGDHQLLNQHWADLQARLEARGVKLGPLGGEGGFNSGNSQQQRQPARDEAADHAAAFAEFAVIAGGASARHAPALRGWESWA